MLKPSISLSIVNVNGKVITSKRSRKSRRIFSFIQGDNFLDCTFYLHVNYGNGFTNYGIYPTKTKLIQALHAFLE